MVRARRSGSTGNGPTGASGSSTAFSPHHAASPVAYAELHCLTNFSFLRGASQAQELVKTAIRRGYQALPITDECSLTGVVRAHAAVKEHNTERKDTFKLIIC